MGSRRQIKSYGSGAAALLLSASVLASSSLRNSSYGGQAVRVRRESDGAEQDFGFLAGVWNQTAIMAFCGGFIGKVVKIYDQTGGSNHILCSGLASGAPFIANPGGTYLGASVMNGDSGQGGFITTNNSGTPLKFTLFFRVAFYNGGSAVKNLFDQGVLGNVGNKVNGGFWSGTWGTSLYSLISSSSGGVDAIRGERSVMTDIDTGVFHVVAIQYDYTAGSDPAKVKIYRDGVELSAVAIDAAEFGGNVTNVFNATGLAAGKWWFGIGVSNTNASVHKISDMVVMESDLTLTQIQAISSLLAT